MFFLLPGSFILSKLRWNIYNSRILCFLIIPILSLLKVSEVGSDVRWFSEYFLLLRAMNYDRSRHLGRASACKERDGNGCGNQSIGTNISREVGPCNLREKVQSELREGYCQDGATPREVIQLKRRGWRRAFPTAEVHHLSAGPRYYLAVESWTDYL